MGSDHIRVIPTSCSELIGICSEKFRAISKIGSDFTDAAFRADMRVSEQNRSELLGNASFRSETVGESKDLRKTLRPNLGNRSKARNMYIRLTSTRNITPKSLFKGRSGGLKDVPYPISRATVVCFFSFIEKINKLNIYFPSKSVLQDRPAGQGYQGCQAVSCRCVRRCHRDGERFRRMLESGPSYG